jgi:multidrug efflux system membrane fusion protein
VKTGDRFAGRVVILSGVKPGDRVAASGQIRLLNGAAVTVSPTDSLNPPAAVPRY